MHQYRHAIVRMRLGQSDRAIAQAGLMGRKKAGELRQLASRHGFLDLSNPLPEEATLSQVLDAASSRESVSLVLPYQEEVTRWWGQGIQGTTIHQTLIRKYGFCGSYSSIRRFLQGLEQTHPQVTTVLDFSPGDVAQVDFGSGPKIKDVYTGQVFSTWVFVMVLAWSRHQYAELVKDQKVATWLLCHRHAFAFFAGVPKRVMIDNPKSAITRACYYDPEVQRAYAACAEGYGFLISPCPPRDPKKKGRVESGVKYVKNNFLPLRNFRSLSDANGQLREWVLSTAGNRIHGTTQEKPLSRFAQTERHLLTPLPDIPPELASWTRVKVHGDCHVQFEKCRYSVPFRLVHQSLWLRAGETTVRIYKDQQLVALHSRLHKPGARSSIDDHLPPDARAYKMRDPQWCLIQAKRIGPACRELIECLFAHRVLDKLRAAQGVIGLGRRYGTARLEAACTRALAFDSPLYRTVKTILDRGLDQQPATHNASEGLANVYTGSGHFCRDTTDLFNHTDNPAHPKEIHP
jgi:transposase